MSGAGLNSLYVSSLDLEPYFVSNQNGEANSGGVVTFYKDDNRTQQKLVYQLSQNPSTGAYSYVPLPNPLILSGVGTFQDAGGNNIAVYYYPYDEFGNEELYYITVYDAFGNLQFTREAWPFPLGGSGPIPIGSSSGISNQLSNPQFADVYFVTPTITFTIVSATTTTQSVAPGWDINIVTTGASTVTVTRTAVVGQAALPNNPPFTLDFTIGANVTSCQLIQTLYNNPDWAAPQISGLNGYLAGSILIGSGTSVSMQYVPSAGNPAQTILSETNTSGLYNQVYGTIQLQSANNTQTGAVGYDQIIVNILNLPGTASISNIQVVPLASNITGVQYDQTPVNRQRAYYQNIVSTMGHIGNGNTGRLTLTSGVPVTTMDVTAATTLYYTPYKGNNIWLYINSTWINYTYNELSIAVPAIANKMYDVFVTVTNGLAALILVAWTSDSTRATALTTQNGIYVLTGHLNYRYIGSFRTTGTSGQTEDSTLNRYVYNYYNRVTRCLDKFESTASWVYTMAVWRQANGNTANQVNFVTGVVEESFFANVSACANNTSIVIVNVGIGLNSTSTPLGITAAIIFAVTTSGADGIVQPYSTSNTYPTLGLNNLVWLEYSSATGLTTWYAENGQANASSGITARILM